MTFFALLTHLGFFAALLALSSLITWIMVNSAQVMDIPNERSSHSRPVPKSGGIAVVLVFLVGTMAIYFYARVARIDDWQLVSFISCGVLVAAVSFVDDITQSSFFAKAVAQAVCTGLVLASGLVIKNLNLPILGDVPLGGVGYVLTFLWIVGLTNAYNFMDGLDGLAAGVAVVAGAFLVAIAFSQNSLFVYLTTYTLIAGVAGFLVFNFPPARIFMGDVGSAFLGFTFATLAVIGASLDRGHLSFYVVPLLLFQFIFDTIFTFVRRLIRGERVHQAHRSHLYQLLNRMGFSHLQISLFHYAVAVAQGVGACLLVAVDQKYRGLVLLPFLLFNAIYAWWTVRRAGERGLLDDPPKSRSQIRDSIP